MHYPNLRRGSHKLVATIMSLSLLVSVILLLFPFNVKSMIANDLPTPWQNNDIGLVGIPVQLLITVVHLPSMALAAGSRAQAMAFTMYTRSWHRMEMSRRE